MEILISTLNKLNEISKEIWNWKKQNVWAWIFKGVMAVLIILLAVLFTVKVLPIIILAIVFIVFILPDLKNSLGGRQAVPQNIQTEAKWTVAELIFEIANQYASVLGIVSPRIIDEIIPARYPAIQTLNGCQMFRFILRPSDPSTIDKKQFRDDLNIIIEQKLRAGFPNIPVPFPYGMPGFYVVKVDADAYYSGFFRIDILIITDIGSAKIVSDHITKQKQQLHAVSPSALADRDF